MKRRGRHPEKALTAVGVRALSKPGRYADGNGLYLVVEPSGAKWWMMRVSVTGRVTAGGRVKRQDIGLGGLQTVSLADAREKALRLRTIARAGGDPLAEKRKQATTAPTFEEAARLVHAEHSAAWRNGKHKAQWINTLRDYAFPAIGNRRIDQIDTPDVLRVLGPIWLTKPETARRVRQRLRAVFDWAKAAGHRSGDNPADSVKRGLPRHAEGKKHHAAMAFDDVPAFVASLPATGLGETTRLALEFLILTAVRTGETLGALQAEFDLKAKVWTIPAERMKAGREHRVPLSSRAVAIVERASELSADSDFLFASATAARPLSNMVFLMALRRMGLAVTAHGFRSAFRDWASERTGFPHEVAEMALAHSIKDKAEAAYRRGDLFEKRAALMEAWSGFIGGTVGKVVPMRARGGK